MTCQVDAFSYTLEIALLINSITSAKRGQPPCSEKGLEVQIPETDLASNRSAVAAKEKNYLIGRNRVFLDMLNDLISDCATSAMLFPLTSSAAVQLFSAMLKRTEFNLRPAVVSVQYRLRSCRIHV